MGSTKTETVWTAGEGVGVAGSGIEGGRLSVIGSPRDLTFPADGVGVVSISRPKAGNADFSSSGVRGGEGDEVSLVELAFDGVLA